MLFSNTSKARRLKLSAIGEAILELQEVIKTIDIWKSEDNEERIRAMDGLEMKPEGGRNVLKCDS
jgi:hypothetical protein